MMLKKLLSLALVVAISTSSVHLSGSASHLSETSGVEITVGTQIDDDDDATVTETVTRTYLASGDSISQGGLLYTLLDDGTYEVGYDYSKKKPVGTVIIPEKFKGKLVTRIADAGFADCGELVNVIVPNCVTSVGTNAFYGTKFLNDQDGTVKYAGKVAVYCDPEATKVTIAAGTLGLADKLFYRCPELVSAKLPTGLLNLGSMTFNDCQKLTTVNIPKSITTIGSGVFANCISLSAITIPSGVTDIGAYAFYHTNLQTITIPKTVTKIGKGAFENSSLNTSGVVVGKGYMDVGGRAFYGTPFYSAQGNLKYVGSVFLGCGGNVTKAKLKAGTTAIADMAFSGHEQIASVTIPASVKSIGSDAFFDCRKLTTVTIPEGTESIGEDAFRLCTGLQSISLPLSLKTIGEGAFYGCSELKTVNYPGSAGEWANNFKLGTDNTPLLKIQPTLGKTPKKPAAVTELTAAVNTNSITLSWKKSEAANIYRIYEQIDGKWVTLGKTYKTTYTASGLENNTEYKFRVRAISRNIIGGSAELSAKTKVPAVSNVKAIATQDSITLSWDMLSDVDCYRVYIYKDDKWTAAAKTKSNAETSCVIDGLKEKTTYQLRIYAYKGKDKSAYCAVKATTTAAVAPGAASKLKTTDVAAKSVTLSWNKGANAKSYRLYVCENDKWIAVKKTTATSYTVSGLKADTDYKFRLVSVNDSKRSKSVQISVKTAAAGTPAAVTGLKVTDAAAKSVTLSWNKMSSAKSYRVYMVKNNKWVAIKTITAASATINGLKADTDYKFGVVSLNGSKRGKNVHISVKTAAAGTPAAVTGLKVTDAAAKSVTLSWNKVSSAKSYRVYMVKNNKWAAIKTVTAASATINGLKADTGYKFGVVSLNDGKRGKNVPISVKTAVAGTPAAVTGLKVTDAAAKSVTLSWNKVSSAKSYRVYMIKNNKWVAIKTITAASATISGLKADTGYKFGVVSLNDGKRGKNVPISVKTAVAGTPAAVTGLKVTDAAAKSVTLSWNKVSSAKSYRLYVCENGKWIAVKNTTATSYTVRGLKANTDYKFRLVSLNGTKRSRSVQISVKTAISDFPVTVTGLKATAATTSSITISWNKTPTADSYEIDMYKGGKWIYVAKITGNTYSIKGLSANTSYQFKVFSFRGSNYSSSARLTAKTAALSTVEPLTVTGLKASSTSNSITISWNKTPTADSYEIDMYKGDKWIYVAKITGNTYTVKGLSANTSYQFKVFSFRGSKYSSSARLTAKTAAMLAPSINYAIAPEDVQPAKLSKTQVMMKGIDVSGWQGEIDFTAVKSSGVDFVIVKAGETDVIVDTWEKNYKNAKDAGLLVGAYWFCTATTLSDAKKEVQLFITALKGKKLDFPVYLDMELMGQFDNGKEFCTQLVETFCSELENAGYYSGVYCSKYWYTYYVDDNVRLKRPSWIAQYDDKCYYDSKYGIWQFDAAEVDGVEYDCDRNWGYFDYSRYIKAHNLNGF